MATFKVGEPYPALDFPQPERGEYNFYEAGHELRLLWNDPTENEVAAVRQGPTRFAFVVRGPVIFFLFRFGDMPWSDAPYSVHLVPEDRRGELPENTSADHRALLQVHLVGARSGVVAALRAVSLSPNFTRALETAIRRQAAEPFPGQSAYDAAIAETYRRFPSSAAMAKAARAATRGGA